MSTELKILILEDSANDEELMIDELKKSINDFDTRRVDNKEEFLQELSKFNPDLVLCDYFLPSFTAMDALEILNEKYPKIPSIIVTGTINEETAVFCMKNGADDYILKDNLTRLGSAVQTVLEKKRLREEKEKADEQVRKLSHVVTQSPVSIVITDLKGTIEYVNYYFSQITGYSEKEVIGKNPSILKSGKHAPEFYQKLWNTISAGKIWRGQFHNKKKNGELFWEEAVISPVLNEKKEITNFIALKEDISDRKQAEDALKKSREQLRKLSVHLQSAAERERTKIAREVHDDLGQALTALKIDISNFRDSSPKLGDNQKNKIGKMLELADMIIKSVKRISSELRPSIIDDLGLAAAVEWHVEEFQKRTKINCRLKIDPEDMDLQESISIALYRIIQEALTNIARHSKANTVKIDLLQKDSKLNLSISDNGVGLKSSDINNTRSLGILGMKERARALQGRIQFKNPKKKGTKILVSIPLKTESKQ